MLQTIMLGLCGDIQKLLGIVWSSIKSKSLECLFWCHFILNTHACKYSSIEDWNKWPLTGPFITEHFYWKIYLTQQHFTFICQSNKLTSFPLISLFLLFKLLCHWSVFPVPYASVPDFQTSEPSDILLSVLWGCYCSNRQQTHHFARYPLKDWANKK